MRLNASAKSAWRHEDLSAPAGHYLGGVNVLPEYRRRGVASKLVAARLDWIFARSAEAWYFANARNESSIALHARFGFAAIARASEFHGTTFDDGEGILFRLLPSVRSAR